MSLHSSFLQHGLKTIREQALPAVILFLLTVFAFRTLLVPEILSGAWDHSFPLTINQVNDVFRESVSIIRGRFALGISDNQAPMNFYFWIAVYPLVSLFGIHASKALVIGAVFLSGYAMYLLLSRLRIARSIALLFAGYFMFNPFTYSRIVAGHFNVLLSIPFFVLFFIYLQEYVDQKTGILSGVCILLLLVAFSTYHPMMMGYIAVGILVSASAAMISRPEKRALLFRTAILTLLLILINSHWLVPMSANYLKGKPFFRNDLSVRDEMKERISKAVSSGRSIMTVLNLSNNPGLDTEYIYPVSDTRVWSFAQWILLVMLLFTSLRWKRAFPRRYVILFLLSIIITSGTGNPVGKLFYEKIFIKTGPVFFEYSNSYRFLLLSVFSLTILLAIAANRIYENSVKMRWLFVLMTGLLIGIRVQPFFTDVLFMPQNNTSQPMALKMVSFDHTSKFIFDTFFHRKSEYRTGLIPPYQIAYAKTDGLSYGTQIARTSVEDFFNGSALKMPFQLYVIGLLAQRYYVTDQIGKLLALANTEYLFAPHVKQYYYYTNFGYLRRADEKEIVYASNDSIRKILSQQSDVVQEKLADPAPDVTVWRNRDVLPRIFGIDRVYGLAGGYDALLPLMHDDVFNFSRYGVTYIQNLTLSDLDHVSEVITINGDTSSFIPVVAPREYMIDYSYLGPRPLGDISFQDLRYLSIPDKQKGWLLREDMYKLPVRSEDQVILLKIVSSEASQILVGNRPMCTGITCSGFVIMKVSPNELPQGMNLVGGDVAIEWMYVMPARLYERTQKVIGEVLKKHGTIDYRIVANNSVEVEKPPDDLLWFSGNKESLTVAEREGLAEERGDSDSEIFFKPESRGGFITLTGSFPEKVGSVDVTIYPRFRNRKETTGIIRLFVGTKRDQSALIGQRSGDKSDIWDGVYEKPMTINIPLSSKTVTITIALEGEVQLWANKDHPIRVSPFQGNISWENPYEKIPLRFDTYTRRGIYLNEKSGDVAFERIRESLYRVTRSGPLRYLYFSQQFDSDWIIREDPNIRPMPAGAEGMIFMIPPDVPATFHIEYRGQRFVDLGYAIIAGTWGSVLVLFVLDMFFMRKRHTALL